MIRDLSKLTNFVYKFMGKIMGYGDYQIGNVMISRVYYVEGLGHNLFSIGQFCDLNLEVAFCQHTCYIRNLEGVDLLTESRGNNMYTLSLGDMMASSPICLLSKASKTKSWLWHQRLSHLNFGTINHLARHGVKTILTLSLHTSTNSDQKQRKKMRCTQKFTDEISDLRAISGHMLGAVGVQIPENNLDDQHSSREEDETSKTVDPQDLLGADNRPPKLEKDMYNSWKSIMELYIINRQHGRMILESVENGLLIWPTIKENGVTRPKKYSELSASEATQADCDVKATNIIFQGLPPEVYLLVSNHQIAKELWERIQLLMQGTSLTKQERECKLYDMNIYNVKLKQFQVNTKFLNTLPPEWSKFVIDVKLVQDLHTTNIDQLHAYLGQHEFHANDVRLMHECNSDPLALSSQYASPYQSSTHFSITYPSNDYQSSVYHNVYSPPSYIPQMEYAPIVTQQQFEFPQQDSDLTVPIFKQGIPEGQATQTVITHNDAYQADDLDIYDYDCDELNTAKVALMANLSHYGSDALVEKAQQLEPKLYDGNVIKNTCAIMIPDSEETLMLAEESRLKMTLKQQDSMILEKKVNTIPIDYVVLNQLSQDFKK
nr:retrovirus-related Pol polyprotein from transposon TNT 1-94 [Tanacetum cinerariifolium]